MSNYRKIWMLAILLLNSCLLFSQNREYLIKAAVLEKMTRFIKWPDSGTMENKILVIGVISDTDETVKNFEQYYSEQTVQGKPVSVQSINNLENIKVCDILYISRIHSLPLEQIQNEVQNLPVLLVSEQPGYARKGTHINLLIVDNRLQYEINETLLRQGGFYVWAQLLNSAVIIKTGKEVL